MKHPMTHVFVCLQVSGEDLSSMHRILSCLSDIDRSFDGSSKLEFVSFDWNHSDQWHLDDQLFRELIVETVLLDVPSGSLEVDSLDVGSSL